MNYLGIDYGEKRIGLAGGDDELGIASPLPAAVQPTKKERLRHIEALIHRRSIGELVVGYPLNMNGSTGFKAREVDAFIDHLEKRFSLPVHRIDERLSSQVAAQGLREIGKKTDRKSGELDSRAAALILQDFLDLRVGPGLLPPE